MLLHKKTKGLTLCGGQPFLLSHFMGRFRLRSFVAVVLFALCGCLLSATPRNGGHSPPSADSLLKSIGLLKFCLLKESKTESAFRGDSPRG